MYIVKRFLILYLCTFPIISNAADTSKETKYSTQIIKPSTTSKKHVNKFKPLPLRKNQSVKSPSRNIINPPTRSNRSNNQQNQHSQTGKIHSRAREARNLKNLQELQRARNAIGAGTIGSQSGNNDPAAGTALGGRGFNRNNSNTQNRRQPGMNAQGCINDPSKCFSTTGNNRSRGINSQRSSLSRGMTKGNRQDWASEDGSDSSAPLQTENDSADNINNVYYDDDNGTVTHIREDFNSKGDEISKDIITESSDGNFTRERFDQNKNLVIRQQGRRGGNVTAGPGRQTGQPREDGREGWSRPSGCKMDYASGKCVNSKTHVNTKNQIKNKTSQPGRGDNSRSNGSARPRLSMDAVTNSGDGSFVSNQRHRKNIGGVSIDLGDPCEGFQNEGCNNSGSGGRASPPSR